MNGYRPEYAIYEKKRVKVIVRFFEQDMVLLLVIKKHPKIDDNDFLFNFSSSAYFSANKGDDIYVCVYVKNCRSTKVQNGGSMTLCVNASPIFSTRTRIMRVIIPMTSTMQK